MESDQQIREFGVSQPVHLHSRVRALGHGAAWALLGGHKHQVLLILREIRALAL
jgi:hypothetical protein